MNEKVLRVLEYTKVIGLLSEKASSDPGKNMCINLKPLTDIEEINLAQINTQDALNRLFRKDTPSFSGNRNVLGLLKTLEIGSVLSSGDLLKIASLL